MRLMRLGERGQERPAVLVDDETCIDVSDLVDDFDERFFAHDGVARLRTALEEGPKWLGPRVRITEVRVGAPLARPHQIICIGLNYRDHAEETGQAVPDEPIVFTKSPNTLVGPHDDVKIPRGSTKLDWEVELGIVVGRRCRYLESDQEARESIAGYVLVNDVSERGFQLERSGQWTKGKSAESFNPAGPWLVTPDEVGEVGSLSIWLNVNGIRRQRGSTATMIFNPYFIIRYLSQFMVLEPGDLVNTGTPPGVGMGQVPPIWLRPGDVMELGIDKLGCQRQTVVAFS